MHLFKTSLSGPTNCTAIILLTASLLILSVKRDDPLPWAKLAFAAATGPLGFGFFRLMLGSCYSGNLVWFAFWEETTELLFIVAVAFVLWTFRHGLFPRKQGGTGVGGLSEEASGDV